jgi:hypothetical protein
LWLVLLRFCLYIINTRNVYRNGYGICVLLRQLVEIHKGVPLWIFEKTVF